MQTKWFAIPIFLYLIFLVSMCFIVLGKFATLVLPDGWWTITKDASSVSGSLATTFGLPWAIWLYFKQRQRDREEQKKKIDEEASHQLQYLLQELINVLTPEKLLTNQIAINSLLFRIDCKREEINKKIIAELDFTLRTHLNQLFNNIKPCHLVRNYSETAADYLTSDTELNELDSTYRKDVLQLARWIVNSGSFNAQKIGEYTFVSLDKGFSEGLLSRLVQIAQPICIGNYTQSVTSTIWDSKKLTRLFDILPSPVAAYIYLAYSDNGKNLIIELSQAK